MKDITIVATTWLPPGKEDRRLKDFTLAMATWWAHLKYDGVINLHVADDGTLPEWYEKLQQVVETVWRGKGSITHSQQDRHGVGASLNAGLAEAFKTSPYVLYAVDDWQLLELLDLNPWIAFMEDNEYNANMVRFFPHPDLTGTFKHIPPYGWAVNLDRHHYVFATRPCLWHQRFFEPHLRGLGWFKEDASAIEVEQDFNYRYIRQMSRHEIWLALPEVWRHMDAFSLSDLVPA